MSKATSEALRTMPTNAQMESCVARERGALVFWSPDAARRRPGTRVQIVEVFSLQVATGYTRDPQGRLLLEALPSLAAGRSWSLAKAAQLIRNHARPHRWVAFQQNRRAWGLFWAGGGLQHCRELLAAQASEADLSCSLVPVTLEALLKVLLNLEVEQPSSGSVPSPAKPLPPLRQAVNPWNVMAWTSLAWLTVLGITTAAFLGVLERQNRQLELLLERTTPSSMAK